MRLTIVILCTLAWLNKAQAQELTYASADDSTYQQLISKRYKALIITGKQALAQHIDFYYLRMRLGIGYYNQQQYRLALPQFEAANKMNPAEVTCQEYLYYSYLLVGRTQDANALASTLSNEMQTRINYHKTIIDAVTLGVGTGFNNNVATGKSTTIIGAENIYGSALYQGNTAFYSALVTHTLANRLQLMYGFSGFNIASLGVVNTPNDFKTIAFNNTNYQYNLGANYQLRHGFNASVGAGVYPQNFSNYSGEFNATLNSYDFKTTTTHQNSWAGTATIGKQGRYLHGLLGVAMGNFVSTNQLQLEGTLVYYPLGNNNLYEISAITYKTESNQFIISQKAGGKLFKWLWIEAKASYGNHSNYISQGGFLTYNTADALQLIAGMDLKIYFGKHLQFSPGYKLQQVQRNHIYYTTYNNYNTITNNYFNQLLTTSLTWNF